MSRSTRSSGRSGKRRVRSSIFFALSAPWFKVFKGERIDDHHPTLEEKRKAREGSAR